MYISLRNAPASASPAAEQSTEAPVIDPSADPSPPSPASRRVPAAVVAFGIVSLLTDVSTESVAAVLPLYITAVMGMGPLAYGFLDGIYQGVSAAVRLLGGWWADETHRPKWVAFVGYLVSAISKIGLLLTVGFAALSAMVAVDRLGKGLRTGPRDALIATASHPDQLGRNFGVHRALDTTGALAGPLIAFAVLAAIPVGLGGYHSVFVVSAAFAFVGVAVLALVVPDLRTRGAGARPAVRRRRVALRLADLARPDLRRLLLAAGVLGLVTIGDGFIYLALADGGDLATRYFPLLFVGTNAAYLALAVPLGRLADRVGRARVFLAGHVLLLAVYVLVGTRLVGTAGAILVLVLLGTFYAATDGVLSALAVRLVPEDGRASGIAAAQTVVALTRFGSSVAFGLVWQLAGRSTALLAIAGGLLLAMLVAAWLLRPLLRRGPQAVTP